MFDLRYYQQELIDGACKAWESHQSVALISATGTGKTEIYMSLAVREPKRVLVLVHRDYLITQPIARLRAAGFDDVGVEKAGERSEIGLRKAKIVFASVQSIGPKSQAKRLASFNPEEFSLVIVDEGHRATSPTYRTVLDHLKRNPILKVLVLTATPNRKDGVALANICDSVAGVYGPSSAMAEGWIAPTRFYRRDVKSLDFSKVRMKGTDLDPEQVQELLMQEKPLHEVCASLAEDRGPTIVFCPEVAVARAYESLMNTRYRPGRAKMLFAGSSDDEREESGQRLAQGEIDYIFQVNLFCLDAETEILTSDGWVGIDGMTLKHKVANWDDGRIFFKEPQQIIRRQRFPGERMVTLSGSKPSMNIRVTDRHRMVARHGRRHPWRIERAADVVGKVREFPISGVADPFDVLPEQEQIAVTPRRIAANAYNLRQGGMTAAAARTEAVKRAEHRSLLRYAAPSELTLEECELIGFWLGDGSVNHLRRGGKEYTIFQVKYNKNIVARVEHLLAMCGIHSIRREKVNTPLNLFVVWSLPRGTGGGHQQRSGVYRIEPYLVKDGTPLLWGLSAEQLRAMLRGLWMADGTCHNDSTTPPLTYAIVGRRRSLFDLLQAIAVCRGMSVGIRTQKKTAKPHHTPLHYLCVYSRDAHRVGKHPMCIEVEPWRNERIWCVTVDTGNIVTRRHGCVVVTGNTEGFDLPNLLRVVWAAPTASLVKFTQGVGRVFRTHPALRGHLKGTREDSASRRLLIEQSPKPFGIVVTYFPQNCKHELCDPVDILGGDDLPSDVRAFAKQLQDETSRQGGGSRTEDDIETAKAFCELRGVIDDRLRELKAKAEFADHAFDPMSGRKQSTPRNGVARPAIEASSLWPEGEQASEKQRRWLIWKGASPQDALACTKWRAFVVRELVEMGVSLNTAMGYGRKQALKVRDDMQSRKNREARTA